MEISYLGSGSVRLGGNKLAVVCGPEPVKVASGIAALTMPAPTADFPKEVMVIDGPGEYEVGGTLVTAVATGLGQSATQVAPTSYVFSAEDLAVAYLAAVDKTLTNPELEALGQVDVLVLPLGQSGGFEPTVAAGIIAQLEPKYIVPVPAGKETADWAAPFLKEVGATPQRQAKLKLSARDLPEEPVVVLLEELGSAKS